MSTSAQTATKLMARLCSNLWLWVCSPLKQDDYQSQSCLIARPELTLIAPNEALGASSQVLPRLELSSTACLDSTPGTSDVCQRLRPGVRASWVPCGVVGVVGGNPLEGAGCLAGRQGDQGGAGGEAPVQVQAQGHPAQQARPRPGRRLQAHRARPGPAAGRWRLETGHRWQGLDVSAPAGRRAPARAPPPPRARARARDSSGPGPVLGTMLKVPLGGFRPSSWMSQSTWAAHQVQSHRDPAQGPGSSEPCSDTPGSPHDGLATHQVRKVVETLKV